MDEFKVGDIVKTIRQSCGVNFSEAVVVGRYEKYICVIAKTRRDYDDWWVYPKDIIKTKQELLDDRDLELAKTVSTIYFDEIYEPDEDSVGAIYHSPIYVGLRSETEIINVSLLRVRLSSKSVQLCFNKQKFLDEVLGLLEDMYYDDDDVDIHVYTVGNCT